MVTFPGGYVMKDEGFVHSGREDASLETFLNGGVT